MSRYEGKRARRPLLLVAAVGSVLLTGAACLALALTLHGDAERFLPWIGIAGMIVFYVLLFLSFRARPATIDVDGGEVRASWRTTPLRVRRVASGRWVVPALDTPMGMLLEIAGEGASLHLGGEDHDGRGYANDARPRRGVDISVSRDDFDRIAATLGVAQTSARPALELVRSTQSAGGLLRMMAPWVLTIVVVSALGVTLAFSGVGDRVSPLVVGGVTGALVVGGLAITIVRSSRARAPGLVLQPGAAGLTLTERGETTTIPWSAVHGEPRQHVVYGRGSNWTMPALELTLGDRTIGFVAWGGRPDWLGTVPALRPAPRWLAGTAQFAALLAELRRRKLLR